MLENVVLDTESQIFKKQENLDVSECNFIYGKNGTGKSTVARLISNQASDTILFNGINGVLREDKQLDAILLGNENVAIESKLREKQESFDKSAEQLTDLEIDNKKKKRAYDKRVDDYQDQAWNKLYKHFNSVFPEEMVGWGGGKKQFSFKLKNLLRDNTVMIDESLDEQNLLRRIQSITSGKRLSPYSPFDMSVSSSDFQDALNQIPTNIAKGKIAKRILKLRATEWVSHGKHYLEAEQPCPFCGQQVSEAHYHELLEQFAEVFDESYENLEKRLKGKQVELENAEQNLNKWLLEINDMSTLNSDSYKVNVASLVPPVSLAIRDLKDLLVKKQTDSMKKVDSSKQFHDLDEALRSLNNELAQPNEAIALNNKLVNESATQSTKVKHDVYCFLKTRATTGQFTELRKAVVESYEEYQASVSQIEVLTDEQKKITTEMSRLASQTQSEEIAVNKINKLLNAQEKRSFKLVRVASQTRETNGYYTVQDVFGNRRTLLDLSTGEKNLIAFLYFYYLVTSRIENKVPSVIVIDDPITSNDDQSSFLIITLIQRLLFTIEDCNKEQYRYQIFTFTHNSGFYLNVKQWSRDPYKSKKNRFYHFESDGNQTSIVRIDKKDRDIVNNYDEIWREARFSFDHDMKQTMWNQFRRILETYLKFNNRDGGGLNEEIRAAFPDGDQESQKIIALQLVKTANANSHSIDDLMEDISPWTKQQILDSFRLVFHSLKGDQHFEVHWK